MPRPISVKAYFTWPIFFLKIFVTQKTFPIPWNTNASIYILCIFSYLCIWSFFIPSWCFDVFFVTVCYLDYVVRYCYKSPGFLFLLRVCAAFFYLCVLSSVSTKGKSWQKSLYIKELQQTRVTTGFWHSFMVFSSGISTWCNVKVKFLTSLK